MMLINPFIMTDVALISSNIAETDYAAWLVGTTYGLAGRVIVISANSHKVYESLQAANLGHTPSTSPTWWIEVGNTNRWKMFDQSVQAQSSNATTIDVSIKPTQRVDSVALLNISAYSVQVKMTDVTDGLVYNKTTTLASSSGINNWYMYFYEPVVRMTDFIANDLPPYSNATIQIILTETGGTAYCGGFMAGLQQFLGNTQYGAKVGIQDYSVKTIDTFGNYTVLERAYKKTATFNLQLYTTVVDQLVAVLTPLRATPIIYYGANGFGSTVIYGFYKDLAVTIAYPETSTCTLEIEGLT